MASVAFLEYQEWRAFVASLDDVDLLFLEDAGAEVDKFKAGEPIERLREILNEFKHKWLFVTTNVMPEQWGQKWDARIADRFFRNSSVVTLRDTKPYSQSK